MSGRRTLGIELGGARRTALVCLEHFPTERKIQLLETRRELRASREEGADLQLLRAVNAMAPAAIGVDAPLSLPPCLPCTLTDCPGIEACPQESVRWMREESERQRWSKARRPTPYTVRPVDLLLRGRWQLDSPLPIPAEEGFGSGRAPLAARMQYLRRHLACRELLEVNPRLSLAGLAPWYGLSTRELRRARDLQYGPENRFTILSKLTEPSAYPELPRLQLFTTDLVVIARDLSAFDAFLCALMPVWRDLGLLADPEIDPSWGWIARPRLPAERRAPLPAGWGSA